MSKELESLIRLEYSSKRYEGRKEDLDTIFTALKDYEHLELYFKQAKELKELYKAELKNVSYYNYLALKYKKAVEIIKEHRLDIDLFLQFVTQNISYQHYVYCVEQSNNAFAKRFLLNEQEYELLKEILKWKH